MNRFANENDYHHIREVWDISFKNEIAFSDWYFNNIYSFKNTILIEEKGVVCSVLQRIPYYLNNLGDVTYIYGACTLPEYRGKGLMAKLLDYSEQIDRENNIKASILIPQQNSLFEYYARFGYKPEFKLYNNRYIFDKDLDLSHKLHVLEISDIADIDYFYTDLLKNNDYILRDYNYWVNQFNMFKSLGGNAFCLKEKGNIIAYALVWNDGELISQELFAETEKSKAMLANKIMQYYNADELTAYSFYGENEIDFGCIKAYDKAIEKNPYMNLMFN